MDLVSALHVALRRWKIVVAVLLLTLLGTGAAYLAAGAIYTASNYVVVVPNSLTSIPAAPVDGNVASVEQAQRIEQAQRGALVSAGGARLVSNLLVTNLNSAQTQVQLGSGSTASYGATGDDQLPVVTVTATGSDEAAVKTLLGRAVDGADGVLANLQAQAGIPASTSYRAPRFAPDPLVTVDYPDRTKVVVAILVAGVGLALLLAVALDGPLTRREQARAGAAYADDEVEPASNQNGTDPATGSSYRPGSPTPGPAGPTPDRPRSQQPINPMAGRPSPGDVSRTDRVPSTSPTSRPGR